MKSYKIRHGFKMFKGFIQRKENKKQFAFCLFVWHGNYLYGIFMGLRMKHRIMFISLVVHRQIAILKVTPKMALVRKLFSHVGLNVMCRKTER